MFFVNVPAANLLPADSANTTDTPDPVVAKLAAFATHFASVPDPREYRTPIHPLTNILVIGLCAIICGAKHFTQMEAFGNEKKDWLAKFLDLNNGIPSHDVFNSVFARLKPEAFEPALVSWITSLHKVSGGQILPIDGKTLRGSCKPGDAKALIHMVSVWASANHLSLGSVVVDEKSNEITAIPRLLELIDVSGGLITIDAMGCQKAIAQNILDAEADYVLQAKDNQPNLNKAITEFFSTQMENDFEGMHCEQHNTKENGHGRFQERYYYVCEVPRDFAVLEDWPGLKALGLVVSYTEREGKECMELRNYILSTVLTGERFAEAVRGHWGIENNLHWQLDVTFGEDDLKLYKGHAPTNLSILMRMALGLLKNEKTAKGGIETKRLRAAWNVEYLEKVLTGKGVETR
jgi:predicted transposase YbfD/YdcC